MNGKDGNATRVFQLGGGVYGGIVWGEGDKIGEGFSPPSITYKPNLGDPGRSYGHIGRYCGFAVIEGWNFCRRGRW